MSLEHSPTLERAETDQIRRLSDNVSEKTDELARTIAQGSLAQQFNALEARIRRQGGLIWFLIIAIVLIGYLNAN